MGRNSRTTTSVPLPHRGARERRREYGTASGPYRPHEACQGPRSRPEHGADGGRYGPERLQPRSGGRFEDPGRAVWFWMGRPDEEGLQGQGVRAGEVNEHRTVLRGHPDDISGVRRSVDALAGIGITY